MNVYSACEGGGGYWRGGTPLQGGLAGQASYSSAVRTESDAESTHAHITPAMGTVCFNSCVQ